MIDDWEDRARRAEDEAATLQCEIDDLRAQLAAEHAAGYRDAVQALRDPPFASVIFESSRLNDFEASQVAEALAVHLESLAAAPRNEGAQTT